MFRRLMGSAPGVVQTINRQLYEVHGFRGNSTNYYDPDNSCINKVRASGMHPQCREDERIQHTHFEDRHA